MLLTKLYVLRPYEEFSHFNSPTWGVVAIKGKYEVGDILRCKRSPNAARTEGMLKITHSEFIMKRRYELHRVEVLPLESPGITIPA